MASPCVLSVEWHASILFFYSFWGGGAEVGRCIEDVCEGRNSARRHLNPSASNPKSLRSQSRGERGRRDIIYPDTQTKTARVRLLSNARKNYDRRSIPKKKPTRINSSSSS
mmetsp:Transcript_12114/g.21879  ORF Transcript_12114/g.21879 Transcript_12114/m.21879 type:complete len:111 (-) Transcript_12114:142-474(-)